MVQPAGTRGFYQSARRRWIANWRIAMAIGVSVLLSIASGYTTWSGVATFTAPDADTRSLLQWILALFVTIGIQSTMLIAAWTVGSSLVKAASPFQTMAYRARELAGVALWFTMFSATLCASVFFSYHTFYTAIAGYFPGRTVASNVTAAGTVSDAQAQGNRSPHMNNLAKIYVRRVVGTSLNDMRLAAEAERRAYFDALTQPPSARSQDARDIIRETPSIEAAVATWRAYQERMKEITRFVHNSMAQIDTTLREQQARRLREQQDAAARRTGVQAELDKAERQFKENESAIRDIEKQIEVQKREIARSNDQLEQNEKLAQQAKYRMECEKGGNQCPDGPRAVAGIGPLYKKAETDLSDANIAKRRATEQLRNAQTKLQNLEENLKRSISDRDSAHTVIAVKSIGLKANSAASDATDAAPLLDRERLAADLKAMEDALAHLTKPEDLGEPKRPAATTGPGPSPSADAAAADEHLAPLAEIEAKCELMISDLSNQIFGPAAAEAQKLSCAQDGLGAAVVRVQELNAGLRRFDDMACRTLGANFRDANTGNLIRRGEQCLDTVGLDGARADPFTTTFGELSREHDATVHPFVQSYHGLIIYNDKLAFLSLGIAAMIDLLVFCISIVGAKESLRRIDRIGSELPGQDILGLATAADKTERASDATHIRLYRRLLDRLIPEEHVPDPDNAPHIHYTGYIFERDLRRGDPESDLVRRQIQTWMSTPKSGVELVLRVPPSSASMERYDTGLIGSLDFEGDNARFFFLRELIIDLAEDIVNWDKAHANERSDAALKSPPPGPRRTRPQSGRPQTTARVTPFWAMWRGVNGAGGAPGAETVAPNSDMEFKVTRPDGEVRQGRAQPLKEPGL